MMKGGFADEQMIGFLRQAEAGMPNKELRRCNDFSNATFYKWRANYTELVRYQGMQPRSGNRITTRTDHIAVSEQFHLLSSPTFIGSALPMKVDPSIQV